MVLGGGVRLEYRWAIGWEGINLAEEAGRPLRREQSNRSL